MSIPVKLFIGKKVAKGPDVLIDYEIVDIPTQCIRAYADLRQKCAIKCNVSPAYVELFWLWDPVKRAWMDLQDEVDNSHVITGQQKTENKDKCLQFRVRFVVRTELKIDDENRFAKRCSIDVEKRFPVYEDAVLRYLYRQKRNDFLSGKDWLSLESPEKDFMAMANTALSLSCWDLMCLSKILESEVQAVKKDIGLKKLLPKYLHAEITRRRFTTGLKVGAKFRHYITYYTSKVNEVDESRQTAEFFMKMYLVSLESAVPSYGIERYNLADGSVVTAGADSGITLQQAENEKQWCKFLEIADMTLSTEQHPEEQFGRNRGISSTTHHSIVSVSKLDGTVKILEMKSKKDAVDLASFIDGLYRLLVDANHYLCKEVSSPALIDHLKHDCHGPINRVFAERLLHERTSEGLAQTGDYVLRRNDEVCGNGKYCANIVSSVSPLRLDQIEIEAISCVKVDTLIFNHLRRRHINMPSTLQRIPPKARHSSNLIVQSCSQQSEASAAQSTDASERKLNLINFTDYSEVSFIETGKFTSVKRFRKRVGIEKSKYVVMKTLLFDSEQHQQNQHTRHIFDKSNTVLVDLAHQHIVRCVGVTLSNTVALEYAKNGSITTYFKQRPGLVLQPSWLLRVLWQMAHAFHYLEEKGFAHGNLCGKNVLLQNHNPQPHIRIADSGVTSMIANVSSNGRSKQIEEPVLFAPWLALEFCFIEDSEPRWVTYPTIEGDKWSFATTVCEILKRGNINVTPVRGYDLKRQRHEVLRNFYKRGSLTACLQPPETLTSNQELYALISNCWSRTPEKRPYFQQILRELSVLLANMPTEVERQGDSNYAPESRNLSMYADEKLKNICDLGEGHFGKVGKFVYYMNRTEHQTVAVKVLKKATIEQQRSFLQEINTMTGLDHRCIVKIYGIAEPSGRIVMEFLEEGSLLSRLKQQTLRPGKLLQFSLQIAEGMLELEQRLIIHRDLAARNVLLVRDETGELHIKISDFGLARVLSDPSDCYIGISDDFPWMWYAPECLRSEHRKFTTRSDVWSYGVTLWEMFSHGKYPTYLTFRVRDVRNICSDMYNYLTEPIDNNRLIKPENCPSQVYNDTMLLCWETDPENRITFREIQKNLTEIIQNS